jgi:hypothetical protein
MKAVTIHNAVTPAKAGVPLWAVTWRMKSGIPAFAGMTPT